MNRPCSDCPYKSGKCGTCGSKTTTRKVVTKKTTKKVTYKKSSKDKEQERKWKKKEKEQAKKWAEFDRKFAQKEREQARRDREHARRDREHERRDRERARSTTREATSVSRPVSKPASAPVRHVPTYTQVSISPSLKLALQATTEQEMQREKIRRQRVALQTQPVRRVVVSTPQQTVTIPQAYAQRGQPPVKPPVRTVTLSTPDMPPSWTVTVNVPGSGYANGYVQAEEQREEHGLISRLLALPAHIVGLIAERVQMLALPAAQQAALPEHKSEEIMVIAPPGFRTDGKK